MIGDSLLGNRQLGEAEIGTRAPIYYTVSDTLTKSDSFFIDVTLGKDETITKTEEFSIETEFGTEDTITKHDRQSALVNGSPVSLIWRKIAKIINTIWTKTPKP